MTTPISRARTYGLTYPLTGDLPFDPLGTVGNSKVWNFASALYSGGASASDFSNVNSTGGNVLSSAGLMSSVAANSLRVGSGNGLYIEPGFTQLAFPTEQNASFFSTATNCSLANSSTVGPDGVSTTFYSTATTTVAGGNRQKNLTVANDSGTYRVALFVATGASQTCRLQLGIAGGTVSNVLMEFNRSTGAITINASGTGTVQAVSGGWRVSLQISNNTSGATTLFTQFYPAAGGSGSADFGGWSVYKQTMLTDYVAATSGTVAQSADVVKRTTGSDLSAAAGKVTITAHTGVGAGTQVLWQRDDGTANNRFTIYRDSSRFIHFVIVAGGVTQSDRAPSIVADDTTFTVSMAWAGSLASYTVGTGTPFLESALTLPTGITTERLGEDTSGNQWGGYIASVTASVSAGIAAPFFYDSFNRANTAAGTMSNPPVGNAYGFYGPFVASYPLPAATNGYISSKGFVEDQNNTTYMEQNLGRAVSSITAKASWSTSNGSTGNGTLALLVYNVAGTIADCLHIQVGPSAFLIQKRVAGAFTTLATQSYVIAADSQYHDVSATINGTTGTVTLTVDGTTISAQDDFFKTIDGNYVIWENAMQDGVKALKIQSVGAN